MNLERLESRVAAIERELDELHARIRALEARGEEATQEKAQRRHLQHAYGDLRHRVSAERHRQRDQRRRR